MLKKLTSLKIKVDMSYITKSIVIIAFLVLFASCSTINPLTATSNPMGSKVGTSKYTSFLGICINGDASIRSAAINGGITKISTVEVKTSNFLWIISTQKTIVTGD